MPGPNVVWITLDSVRADHTSLDGYDRDTTPALADLGATGTAFRTCIAHSNATLASSGTILTGLAPTRNTLGVTGEVLPEGVETVAERFGAAGYRTACLSRNSYVSDATGLDRGFDRFQWIAAETMRQLSPVTLAKYLVHIRSHSAGFTGNTAKHASPYLMNETTKRWLRDFEDATEPFFFYLHYNEPHRPYYPPLPYLDTFTDDIDMTPREAASLAMDVHEDLLQIVADGCHLSEREMAAIIAMYDAEIAYTDEMIGRLVSWLRERELGETVVVVTADHGELFGEHGLLSHRYVLTDAVTRVPLVIDCLDVDLDLAVDDDAIVQHADVMRTLLGAAGADTAGTVGVDLRETGREFAVSQRGPLSFEDIRADSDAFDAGRFPRSTLTALRTETHRYHASDDGWALYALPDEETDVSDKQPSIAAELSADLEDWLDAHGEPIDRGEDGDFSPAVERQLRDMGYLD